MAIITDDFGDRGGFPFNNFNNNNNALVPRQSTQLASKELGDIIIRSFETVTEAFSEGDVPVNAKQIEEAVKKGINKSDLVKKGFGLGKGGNSSGSKADEALAKLYDERRLDIYKKRQQREEDAEKRAREEREKNIEKKIDDVFATANKWATNPLKGFNDALEKGIKGLFKGALNLFNTPIKTVTDKIKGFAVGSASSLVATGTILKNAFSRSSSTSVGDVVTTPTISVPPMGARSSEVLAIEDQSNIIRGVTDDGISYEVKDDNTAVGEVLTDTQEDVGDIKDSLDDLIRATETQSENLQQNHNQEHEQNVETGEILTESNEFNKMSTGKVLLIIGGISVGIAAIAIAIPILTSKILGAFQSAGNWFKGVWAESPRLLGDLGRFITDSANKNTSELVNAFKHPLGGETEWSDVGRTTKSIIKKGTFSGTGFEKIKTREEFENWAETVDKTNWGDKEYDELAKLYGKFGVDYESELSNLRAEQKLKGKLGLKEEYLVGQLAKGTMSEASYKSKLRDWGIQDRDAEIRQRAKEMGATRFAPNTKMENLIESGSQVSSSLSNLAITFKTDLIGPSTSTSAASSK